MVWTTFFTIIGTINYIRCDCSCVGWIQGKKFCLVSSDTSKSGKTCKHENIAENHVFKQLRKVRFNLSP